MCTDDDEYQMTMENYYSRQSLNDVASLVNSIDHSLPLLNIHETEHALVDSWDLLSLAFSSTQISAESPSTHKQTTGYQ